MSRMVQCVVLKQEAEGLEQAPHPGELGQRIFEQVSREGWQRWLQQLTMIVNEYGLNTADPRAVTLVEEHMSSFFFGETPGGGAPTQFAPRRKK